MKKTLLWGAFAAATAMTPAWGQDVKIVLNEEADVLEPCMATRSNVGRITMQNINETLTFLDIKGGSGLQPKLAESWEQQADGSWRFKLR